MASIAQDKTDRRTPTGSGSRFVLLGAATAILALALVWFVIAFTGSDALTVGNDAVTDPGPAIVTDTATGVEAPLSSDTQGATRTELGSTPSDTTPD